VHRGEGAEAVIHGVAEGEQPGVAEQHVVGEGEHHHDAHLAQERDQEAALEHQRQGQGEQQAAAPERDAAAIKHHTHEPTPRPPPQREFGCWKQPPGRCLAPAWGGPAHGAVQFPGPHQAARAEDQDRHHQQVGQHRRHLGDGQAGDLRTRGQGDADQGEDVGDRDRESHREGLDAADQQRSDEGAAQRAEAADHDHDEDDAADGGRHARFGDEGIAADDAGQSGQRGAAAENQHEDARHVVAERFDHVRLGQRGLDDEADAGARQQRVEGDQHADRDQHHETLVDREVGGEQREQRAVEFERDLVVDRGLAPDQMHDFLDQEGQAEGEQQFGDMAEAVGAAQAVALDHGADGADQQRRNQQAGPEADPSADLVGEVGAQHVEAGVGEIEDAHHAEDQRQAAGQHEQQQAVGDAVQQRDDDEFHCILKGGYCRRLIRVRVIPGWWSSAASRSIASPARGRSGGGGPHMALPGELVRPVQGRSMMQDVGSCESRCVTEATVFQP
jgi:hypothetical protein